VQAVTALAWPDTRALYSGSWDHAIRMWDTERMSTAQTWVYHVLQVTIACLLTALADLFGLAA